MSEQDWQEPPKEVWLKHERYETQCTQCGASLSLPYRGTMTEEIQSTLDAEFPYCNTCDSEKAEAFKILFGKMFISQFKPPNAEENPPE